MNEPEKEKAVEFGSMVSDGLDMSEKAARKLTEGVRVETTPVETITISRSKEVRGLAEDAQKGSMPSETASREGSKEVEPRGDTTTEDTPPMGKVGDKPRTSERKCRHKRQKQRTSKKKGQCDRVNAPKVKERVHDVAKNIKEDGSVPRVPDFAVVEVPTRVNATEGKVHLEQNSCSFEFDLLSLSSVGQSRPNSVCGNVGHERRCEGKSKSGDVAGDISWRKKSNETTRALPTLVGENVTARTEGSETVAQVPDNEVSYRASGLPKPPDQSQLHPRAQSGADEADRTDQSRAHPGAQPDAHQGGRMVQTRAHQGAQSCAHIRVESGRLPEAQDLENAREPDHIRLAEKARDNCSSLLCVRVDLGGYSSRLSIQSSASIEALRAWVKCLVSKRTHKAWGKADLGDSSSKWRLKAARTSQGGSRGVTSGFF
ncbi:hypothetical protein V6N11_039734 [Hibiscus sabdariffa]|uniref:Uncharacterized protein n=1 Tax=Hibiscus sabdariffa TaxID=183260 RepID=A0ABR2NG30_9ROSI